MSVNVRSTIVAQFQQGAKERSQKLAMLTDDLPLVDSGLDSLCFAIVVARLEDELGFDPFAAEENIRAPVTVGDFVKMSENAAK